LAIGFGKGREISVSLIMYINRNVSMKKLITLVVCVSLLFSHPAQANFFTDLFGGLFTIVSYPIQLLLGSTKAPFFVAQNPFVEKEWHKEERVAVGRKPQSSTSQAADTAQPEEQDTPTPAITEPTPLPKSDSATPVPTPSIPAKPSVAPSPSSTPPASFSSIPEAKDSISTKDIIREGLCFAVGGVIAGVAVGKGIKLMGAVLALATVTVAGAVVAGAGLPAAAATTLALTVAGAEVGAELGAGVGEAVAAGVILGLVAGIITTAVGALGGLGVIRARAVGAGKFVRAYGAEIAGGVVGAAGAAATFGVFGIIDNLLQSYFG
jgi:hypothetical protein